MKKWVWVGEFLSDASRTLLAFEESGIYPSELRVHSELYSSVAHLRSRELSQGVPLMVLGIPLISDDTVSKGAFALTP
ncbi:MAG: hypothetical protein U5N21_17600 [Rhodococcus sp. (in: high G+C Gram-positive bacteria)]|nr:hypothetical protein [Rhodococcus sp. (in: high G+C Gram-positive bacteria)]